MLWMWNPSFGALTMHFFLLVSLSGLVSLAAESVYSPVTACDIMWVEIVEVPAQASEQILARLKQYVHLVAEPLVQKVDVLLHIPGAVAGRDNWNLGLEEQRERFLPLVGRGRVAEAWMEDNKAVKVGIVRVEVARLVYIVVVLDKSANLHGVADAVFDYSAKGVEGCSLGEGQFFLAVRHALGPDEVQGELHTVEQVGKLHPCLTGERGFCACAENEETDRGRGESCILPGVPAASSGWVERVSEGCAMSVPYS
jgi:hypothetical protein